MRAPSDLGLRLLLLTADPASGRLTQRADHGLLVRAGRLAAPYLDGRLTDRDGDAAVVERPGYRVPQSDVVDEIAAGKPRRWRYWAGRRTGDAAREARAALVDAGLLRVESRLLLPPRFVATDLRLVADLRGVVEAALRETVPVSRVDPRDTMLVALLAAVPVRTVLDRATRKAAKRRLAELADAAGPLPRAVRQVQQERTASAG